MSLTVDSNKARPLEMMYDWFKQNRENHFFRQNRTPYTTWVSEVALQQTRMQAALPKLKNFLTTFPDLETLAQATEEQVVQAFQGLGYYNRARNLLKGAIKVKKVFRGQMPDDYESLLSIPSIGPYTAAAILSICFKRPVPAIDGNINRIVARLFAIEEIYGTPAFNSKVSQQSGELIKHATDPGLHNEALMELGQKICLRSRPDCKECMLQSVCASYNRQPENLPRKKPPLKKHDMLWFMLVLHDGDTLYIQKLKDFYFLKDHYGFISMTMPVEAYQKFKKNLIEGHPEMAITDIAHFSIPADLLLSLDTETENKVLSIERPFTRATITRHKIKIFTHGIDIKKLKSHTWQKLNDSGQLIQVTTENINSYLSASAFLKGWQLYKSTTNEIFI